MSHKMQPKKKMALTITAAMSLSLCGAHIANADLQSTLNNMFVSNITAPGSYSSQTRSGFVGGGAYVRAPVKPINLAAFDPPRLNAGCGGLDMYGGSFSFINGAQFANMTRYIISNAAGLLFHAALSSIEPMLASISEKFSKMMQDMNSMLSNTCAIANQATSALLDSVKGQTAQDQSSSLLGSALGDITDTASHLFDSPDQKNATMKQTEPFNPKSGNLTWKALYRTQSQDMVGISGIVDPNDPNGNIARLLMVAMIGTEIKTANTENPTSCTDSPGQTNTCGSEALADDTFYPRLVKITDLVNANSLNTYDCSGPVAANSGDTDQYGPHSCLVMTQVPLQFAGTRAFVQNMLWGDDTQTTAAGIQNGATQYNASAPGPNSILGKLQTCQTSGCNFTAPEISMVMMSGPIYNLVKEAQFDWSIMPTIANYIQSYMSVALAEKLGAASVRAAEQAWMGVKDVQMPKTVMENIKQANAELIALQSQKIALQENLKKAKAIADEARRAISQAKPVN